VSTSYGGTEDPVLPYDNGGTEDLVPLRDDSGVQDPVPLYDVGDPITVTKLDWRGEVVYSWQGEVLVRESTYVLIRAVWSGPGTVEIGHGVVFAPGNVFYEHYYADKPYGL